MRRAPVAAAQGGAACSLATSAEIAYPITLAPTLAVDARQLGLNVERPAGQAYIIRLVSYVAATGPLQCSACQPSCMRFDFGSERHHRCIRRSARTASSAEHPQLGASRLTLRPAMTLSSALFGRSGIATVDFRQSTIDEHIRCPSRYHVRQLHRHAEQCAGGDCRTESQPAAPSRQRLCSYRAMFSI